MKSYSVILEGSPLAIEIDGEVQRLGFTVARFVEAGNAADATKRAADQVRADLESRFPVDTSELAELRLTFVVPPLEIEASQVPSVQPGFGFFPAEEIDQ